MEFVTFELAKKLKEKGFREKVIKYYYSTPENIFDCPYPLDVNDANARYSAPTISQVLNWLGDEKQIYILVEPFPSMATKDKVC